MNTKRPDVKIHVPAVSDLNSEDSKRHVRVVREPLINSAPIQIIAYLYAEVNLLAPDFYCLSKNIAILVHISGS